MKNRFILYLVLLAATAQAQYNSLFWKISGNGLKQPSYIYGTMHTSDARVFNFGDSVLPLFATCKAYAMELDPKKAVNISLISKLIMGKGYSLKQMIDAPSYHLLDSIVHAQTGYSVALFDNVAPVFTMTIVEAGAMNLSDSSIAGNTEVLDLYFYNLAQKSSTDKGFKKKKIIGIETVDEQLAALNALSYQEQADLLVKELKSYESDTVTSADLVHYYLNGNLDSLSMIETNGDMPLKLYKALVTDRNIRMANRIAEFITDQSTFIAVGALHLPRQGGILDLLRAKGFKIEAIKSKKP